MVPAGIAGALEPSSFCRLLPEDAAAAAAAQANGLQVSVPWPAQQLAIVVLVPFKSNCLATGVCACWGLAPACVQHSRQRNQHNPVDITCL